jgi:hypothetical protein
VVEVAHGTGKTPKSGLGIEFVVVPRLGKSILIEADQTLIGSIDGGPCALRTDSDGVGQVPAVLGG